MTDFTGYRRHGIPPTYLQGPPIGTDDKRNHDAAMAASSDALTRALKRYAAEVRRERQASVPAAARKMPGYRARFRLDKRPPALSRDPCPRCATRGDLGCAHFAPCDQVPA